MTILGLDGALGAFSVAIARDDEVLASSEIDGKRALEGGLASVADAMREAGITPAEISRLAVGVGPGSFTGIRIAVSYAKALAIGWSVPLVGISSYDLLEGRTRRDRALVVVRGRTGIVCARFRRGNVSESACGTPREVLERVLPASSERFPIFGDAEDVLGVLAERGTHVERAPSKHPPAVAAALLARERQPAPSPHGVRPEYGESPVAKVPRSESLR
jgi:tRNA threonylcarbamoyl adenosine modification protein YeaZ